VRRPEPSTRAGTNAAETGTGDFVSAAARFVPRYSSFLAKEGAALI